MKNFCISFLACIIIILLAICLMLPTQQVKTEYLRIHIRANSNMEIDQKIKYSVKTAVVEFLTPFVAQCTTKQSAEKMLKNNISSIEQVANEVLKNNGFSYKSSARVKSENFPTRAYQNLTLDGGFYDALIINLGSGNGDNWWCVVYPPLCFVENASGYVYTSKIYNIINDFFKRNK